MRAPPAHFFLFLILFPIQTIYFFVFEYIHKQSKSQSIDLNQSPSALRERVAYGRILTSFREQRICTLPRVSNTKL